MHSDPFAVNRAEALRVSVRPIATTRFPMLVIDNVYRDPHAVRDLAISSPYRSLGAGNPGARAEVRGGLGILALHRLVHEHLGEAYGWSVPEAEAAEPPETRFHRMHCVGTDPEPEIRTPHVDSVMLAGVVYLNLPEQCRGGTAFFRHRGTGIAEWRIRSTQAVDPPAVRAALRLGFDERYREGVHDGRWRSYDELAPLLFDGPEGPRDFMARGSADWEWIDAVEMQWNRLVCFPGFVFHTSHYDPSWFGKTMDSGRFTQNLLYYWPAARSDTPQASAV